MSPRNLNGEKDFNGACFTQIIRTSSSLQRTNDVLISRLDSIILFKIKVLFFNRMQNFF